jgi:hypothetical protein
MQYKIFIYGLKQNDQNTYFYIGKTKRPKNRLLQHIYEAQSFFLENITPIKKRKNGKNIQKIKIIFNTIKSGKQILMDIIDVIETNDEHDGTCLEEAWIAHFRMARHPLTNYIYSRRMSPQWYGEKNPFYKEGWAKTPLDYIEKIKSGVIKDVDKKTGTKKTNRFKRRKIAKRLKRENAKNRTKK